MQARAIILAALEAQKDLGIEIEPEIMIPFVIEVKELKFVKKIIVEACDAAIAASGQKMT